MKNVKTIFAIMVAALLIATTVSAYGGSSTGVLFVSTYFGKLFNNNDYHRVHFNIKDNSMIELKGNGIVYKINVTVPTREEGNIFIYEYDSKDYYKMIKFASGNKIIKFDAYLKLPIDKTFVLDNINMNTTILLDKIKSDTKYTYYKARNLQKGSYGVRLV
jgi:hypothetical protein